MYQIVSRELYHYGVLGMKWGIRRYQNKDGSLTKLGKERLGRIKTSEYSKGDVTFRKGTVFNRVGGENEKDVGRTYVSKTELDKQRYIDAAFFNGLKTNITEETPHLMTLEAVKDINIAGAKAQMESFLKVVSEFPIEDIYREKEFVNEKETKESKRMGAVGKELYKDIFKKGDITTAQRRFNELLWVDREINKAFMNDLAKKGYQALIDFNNSQFADLPILVFDREDSLKTVSSKALTDMDALKAMEYVTLDMEEKEKRK